MLSIDNLHAQVEGKGILNGINLDIKPGEVHAIMGPNGSGKSTLSTVIAGHEDYEVTKGSLLYQGADISDLSANISAIYQDTLSTLPYRIKVTGSAQHLNNPQVADLVRALLMCGVRAAFLWRQLGGTRFKLRLSRGRVRDTAARMARELGVTH